MTATIATIESALAAAREAIPVSEARLLLRHVLGCGATHLEAHREEAIEPAAAGRFASLAARRAAGEPVAYLTGTREFYGREFAVSPAVLIPRPETELLVDLGVEAVGGRPAPAILDLGTGSGCLAVTLALEIPKSVVTGADASPAALEVARANAARLGASVRFVESDWFSAVGNARFDLIVSNPPYVAEGDPHLVQGDLRFEPAPALASGMDGLDALRRIVSGARTHLVPGGWLLCEHGYDQARAVAELLAGAGFEGIMQHRDLAGIVRVSGGRCA